MAGADYDVSPLMATEHQAPELLDQPNPVNGTWYTVCNLTGPGECFDLGAAIMTVNETIEMQVTIDGVLIPSWGGYPGIAGADAGGFFYCLASNLSDFCRLLAAATAANRRIVKWRTSFHVEVRKTTANGAGNLRGMVIWGLPQKL